MEENKSVGVENSEKKAKKPAKAQKPAEKADGANAAPVPRKYPRTLSLHYQPVFDVHLNMAIDFETHMQINDRQMGVMLPDQFVPIAEKSSQIFALNRWNLEEGCDAILRCEKREADINRLIIPVSVKYLAKNYFMPQILKIMDQKGVNSDKICFNINESILEAEKKQVVENIKALRQNGFTVSIDDFGVEFTSLTRLGQYEVDYICIHKSLIDEILTDERTQNMVQGIIEFAKKIVVQTRVDGVDSPDKEKLLRAMGVDQLKGDLYGKPMAERMIKG
ncbi:MAG: EAL domain-containing protein [Clostridiales bacterium]|nr:EAL domain-containing protein [Clostridiales bacterium]